MTRRPKRQGAMRSRAVARNSATQNSAAAEETNSATEETVTSPSGGDDSPPDFEALPPEPRAAILVELNSVIDGWAAGSRFDVVLRGRITATAPIGSFSIRDPTGLEIAAVQFGHGDEQQTLTMPDGDTAFRTGFQLFLPMPGGDEIRIADLWVRALGRDGAVFEEGMRLGCMTGQAAILAGPARDMPAEEIPVPPGIVYLESAEITADGRLVVHGWALAMSPVVAVQIFADGRRVGAALQGRERPDVAEAYTAYPNARNGGFVLERPIDEEMRGAVSIAAQVLCLSGACLATMIPLVHPEAVPEAPAPDLGRTILIICDDAVVTSEGLLRIEGWAASGLGIQRVGIEIDGRPVGDAAYGRERVDVAAEYPGIPVGTGFDFEQTIPGLSGASHEIRVIAVNRDGDTKDLVVTVAPPPSSAFRFELDGPQTKDGVAVQPVTGRLAVEGWALARDGIAAIDVELDGTLLGQAHFGMARPDVSLAYPDWEGAARSGYTFHCPSRALPDGEHVIQVIARSKTGERYVHAFRITVTKTDDPEAEASIRRRIRRVERDTMFGILDQLAWRPAFQLIVAGGPAVAPEGEGEGEGEGEDAETATARARELTFRSILEQSWPDWRATVLASGGADTEAAHASIRQAAREQSGRFEVIDPTDTAAWNARWASGQETSTGEQSGGDLIAVLTSGDELGRDALGAFAIASGLHPAADCLYADEFRLAPGNTRPEAFFKPDFSPGLLLSENYIGRPLVLRPALLAATGATPNSLMRDGFHDLALRCTEAAAETHHVAELLSRTDGGIVPNADGATAVLTDAMTRRGFAADIIPGVVPGTWRARRTTPVTGKVSIIVPTCAAKGYIETCLKTLRSVTEYKNYEIVCIDNIPDTEVSWKSFVREHADRIVEMPAPFNWSRFNNAAAAATDGEYLLFLNDDIEITQPDWLNEMLEAAAWPGIGIVGARLLYPNRSVQHAGMFLGDGMGRHAFRHASETDPGYFGLALRQREVIAVTGACLLVRRAIFEQLGRFDESHDVINNDLDFCLRAHRAGLRTIYTPHATLIHHELASRAHLSDDFDTTRFTGEWRSLFGAGDPYFNPRLSRYADDYRVDDEGVRVLYAGHPILDRESVKQILVVKVDHIGDFITSLPAIRRLKAAFPAARLTALVAPASAEIAAVEPAIDECIQFEFFHARSELGDKDLTQDDLDNLTLRLAPYRFDIAVDLRKHLSTRHLLRCSGARVLAGYDSLDNFPWLDVVLEWDGDKALLRKRSHIADDLLNLVGAIDAACEPGRRLLDPPPVAMTADELPAHARHLFDRPVVAIHPGAGNVMKQWPEKHIPPLIDLLIERNDIAVLLVGGRDDEAKAASIIGHVARGDRIASIAGQVSLRDLPRVLTACALFIGGDSGPKHIAAACGVPTIGVHSGVVDPMEWGPMGERAVALYRDMSCAPCFLAKPEHCPRGLACVEMLDPALVFRMAQTFLARPEVSRRDARQIAPPAVSDVTPADGPGWDASGRRDTPGSIEALEVASSPSNSGNRTSPEGKPPKQSATRARRTPAAGRT